MSALPFQNEEQGESLGAAEIRAALGCYAYTMLTPVPEKGSSWAQSARNTEVDKGKFCSKQR